MQSPYIALNTSHEIVYESTLWNDLVDGKMTFTPLIILPGYI